MTASRTFIALDIGGTKIAGALVDEDGHVHAPPMRVGTPARGDLIVAAMIDLARTLRTTFAGPIDGVGIASAGVIDGTGRVVAATDILRDWVGQELAGSALEALGLPTVAINDVHATAIAEHAFGAARDADDALVVAVGTGVGGAIISRGELLVGRTGTAGSVAHLPSSRRGGRPCACGGVDHLESYASGPGVALTYREQTGVDAALETITAAARMGDRRAIEVVEAGGRLLGEALAAITAILDPDVVVIGGGVAQAGSDYWAALQHGFAETALTSTRDVPIRVAALGTNAPLVGAARAAAQTLKPER